MKTVQLTQNTKSALYDCRHVSDDHGKRYSRWRIEAFQRDFTILHTYAMQRATLVAYRTSLHRSSHSSSLRRRSPTSVKQLSLEHIYRILNSHGGGILGLHTRTAHGGQTEYGALLQQKPMNSSTTITTHRPGEKATSQCTAIFS